ncbi:hypothetical protein [Streptomyces longispororuber]|uniref:hypothetical protein n=1 Tax=Streptomyces longispororuber TaxID=68230 RepID=UPI00210C34B0|nr:hypothetical protein [Streptomyces longispororuber]MCQ4211103.1 hypothetical protein [Streptomyces longispororuber]
MSSAPRDRLYALLPAVHRTRDEQLGFPLRALLRIIESQVQVLEDDLDTWYANWFVETCEDWVVPYIGALVGTRRPPAGGSPGAVRALSPRRDVADAVANRRRKGTAAALEAVALDSSGWPARAVELYRHLVRAQHMRHVRLDRPATLAVRDTLACAQLGGPFDGTPHLLDVRRPNSTETLGLHGIASLALFVWRLRAFPVTRAPAFCIDQRYSRYLVNVLGIDTQLFAPAPRGPAPARVSGPGDVPHPLAREEFEAAVTEYYGPGRSLQIWRNAPDDAVPAAQIVVADLTDWRYRPQPGQVVVDPVLGRIAFPADEAPADGVWVSWHYGFPDAMGGGAYRRPVTPLDGRRRYAVGGVDGLGSLTAALQQWRTDKTANRSLHDALIEIHDSADYTESLRIDLDEEDRLEIRAAPGHRPVIRLLNQKANRFDALTVRATAKQPPAGTVADCPPPTARRPRLVLDGLVVSGRSLYVVGEIGEVLLRHCTLVPGWELQHDCRPRWGTEPSVELRRTTARLRVAHSVIGTIVVDQDESMGDPLDIELLDSIVDATAGDLPAVTGPEDRFAHAALTMRRCTVLGDVRVHVLPLAENSIVTGCLHTLRRDTGCVRYSYAPDSHPGPPRYRCVSPPGTVRPHFTSTRYGHPGYCQLHVSCDPLISAGAEDGAELGAFHDLYQPHRLSNLLDHLTEYVPLGVEAAVITAT